MGGCCSSTKENYDGEIELSHFELMRSVGKGAFGKVRVVQHKKDKKLYALKYINKAKCIKMKAVDNIIQERRLLEEVDFPLIVNLRFAFQDDENLFMVIDLMLGGDIRFHLDRQGSLKEEVALFITAEVALALNYLHTHSIIHRDLKPDNVLLDENGHAHLTDFNIAVYIKPNKLLTSIAGSMAYMAPEILAKQGYNSSVDWWSLGVMTYEFLFGKRPFRGKTNDALTHAILHDPLHFPDNATQHVSQECVDFVKKMVVRDVKTRLGCTGWEKFKNDPWVRRCKWDEMSRKACPAPFVPDSKRPNFDATHELEELLLEENPLKQKKKSKRPLAAPTKEHQSMLDQFITLDYTKPQPKQMLDKTEFVDLPVVYDVTAKPDAA